VKYLLRWCLPLLIAALAVGVGAQEDQPFTPVPLPQVIERPRGVPNAPSGPQQPQTVLYTYDVWLRPTQGVAEDHADSTTLTLSVDNATNQAYRLDTVMTEFGTIDLSGAPDALTVIGGGRSTMPRDGDPIVISDVTRRLALDEVIPITLTFVGADGSQIVQTLAARVTDAAPPTAYFYIFDAYAAPIDPRADLIVNPVDATPEATADAPIEAIALYGTIFNWGTPTLNLIGASAAFAVTGEVRESYFLETAITSRVVPFAPVPFASRLFLKPTGLFALLGQIDSERAPQIGDGFLAELLFDDGTSLTVPFILRAATDES